MSCSDRLGLRTTLGALSERCAVGLVWLGFFPVTLPLGRQALFRTPGLRRRGGSALEGEGGLGAEAFRAKYFGDVYQ